MILSGDPPRGRALQVLIVLIVLALALAPFLFPGAKALNTAAKTCVMTCSSPPTMCCSAMPASSPSRM